MNRIKIGYKTGLAGLIILAAFIMQWAELNALAQTNQALKKEGLSAAGAIDRVENRFFIGSWGMPFQTFGDNYEDALDDLKRHYMNGAQQAWIWRNDQPLPFFLDQTRAYVERAKQLDLHFFLLCQGLLPRTDAEPYDFETAKKTVTERLMPFKNDEPVLGWYLFDEPPYNETILAQTLRLKLYLQEEAPNCVPVVNLTPGDQSRDFVYWIPYMNLVFTDMYGYSVWIDSLCTGINAATARPHWVILPTFCYKPGPLPGIAYIRQKIYIVLARGGNGVTFYTYSQTPGFQGIGAEGAWGMVDPYGNANLSGQGSYLWDDLGALARDLEPVGQLIAKTKVATAPIRAACMKTVPSQSDATQPNSVTYALEMGVRKDPESQADFLICWNNDLTQPTDGAVEILEYYLADRKVYDLYSFQEMSVAAVKHWPYFKIKQLAPGDGRIFVVCSSQTFETYKQAILKRRYENEVAIAKLDWEWSKASGLNIAAGKTALDRAQREAASNRWATAEASAEEAKVLFKKALEADADAFKAWSNMRAAQKTLGECDKLLTYNVNNLASLANEADRDSKKIGPLDPNVKPWIDMTMKLSDTYRRLRKLERLGHLRQLAAETAFLSQNCSVLREGLFDITLRKFHPPAMDEKAYVALHDKCDTILPERFCQWNHGNKYKPFDPRKTGIGDTSSMAAIGTWAPYYRARIFSGEEEAKALGLTPAK